jgi:glutamate synthase (NADPH) large chain
VTNPPLDAIREKIVTSLGTAIGPEGNLLEPGPESARLVLCETPFLDNAEMARIKRLARLFAKSAGSSPPASSSGAALEATVLEMTFPASEGDEGLEPALLSMFAKADNAIANGAKVLVLSDRSVDAARAPIPALLAVAGLHNHLVREKKRTRVTLIVETGAVREVHQAALLVGYGASAVNPYLALDVLATLRERGLVSTDTDPEALAARYLRAIEKGVVKIMSKMGISTIASYRGAQIFEAVGLAKPLVDRYFTLTASRLGGIGVRDIATAALSHHRRAYEKKRLPLAAGQYQWRAGGELHLFDPETIQLLQHATRSRKYEIFRQYTGAVNAESRRYATLRGSFELLPNASGPVPLEEVEPIERILPRFVTGAMSYGSISAEAHETLAIAMNRIGGRSNSGEGGEDPARFLPDANGDSRRSAVKQVASARFGVTSAYLVDADELQIKIAQGAKPGEGGQLPGAKVVPWIAKVRHATPGVGLISPPPHHDIYSIEDLAQLIYDLRAANDRARISVKLVAEVGVGTVAAGVAKAKSDVVLISGHDGGTGASPLSSLKHAGVPWELGLAEAQQVLVKNNLRDRVVVQVDGQMKTGRDVVIAALLGAEEFGFATAPLVVMGCVMMRVCHLDTCPVGIATQNPTLRERFTGKAEHVVSFFRFIAEEVRELMAGLGFRTIDEMVGRVDRLEQRAIPSPETPADVQASKLDFSGLLDGSHVGTGLPLRSARGGGRPKPAGGDAAPSLRPVDKRMRELAEPALFYGEAVRASVTIGNQDRSVGTRLGSEITRRAGPRGRTTTGAEIVFDVRGSAGQSFGAFIPEGLTLLCEGDANDYVGKGLSGGTVAVFPPRESRFLAEENIIAGNVVLYGATSGQAFFRGRVGERFAVRNSGASAVAEGVGDHGCEYMTGGVVVVLGPIGRNFAAGMSGGVAYLLGDRDQLASLCNLEMVSLVGLDDEDVARVDALVTRHAALTGSELGRRVLENRPAMKASFSKVLPNDIARILREQASASPKVAAE